MIMEQNSLLNSLVIRFRYMAITDNRQREMPLPDDRMPARCQALAYPEAVLLTDPINPKLKDEVLPSPPPKKKENLNKH